MNTHKRDTVANINAETSPIKPTIPCPYKVSWELVTVTRAKLWIKNTSETEFHQRGLAQSAMLKYAHEMETGGWFEQSGDVISICTYKGHEVVLNGQHRLSAIIESETPLNTMVFRQVPAEAFKHVDQGKERSLKDVLDSAKYRNSVDMQTTIKNLWKYSLTGNPLQNPSSEDQLSVGGIFDWSMENEPGLESWYDNNRGAIRRAARANKVPAGTMAYLYLRWQREDPKVAKEWLSYLENPVINRAPCNALALAASFYRDYKTEIAAVGKASVGHWADVTLLAHQAYNLAWNLCREKSTVKTMAGFKKRITELGNELPELN